MNEMKKNRDVLVYDTTLRDGTQGEGVSFSVAAKLRLTEKMDRFGIDYIEGGFPGSNSRDLAFYKQARKVKLKHAKLAAFGSTRRANLKAEEDPQLRLLLEAETPVVTIVGKSSLLHVREVLRTSPEENLRMIEDTIRFFRAHNKEVIFDAEHFCDGYTDEAEYAVETMEAAHRAGARWLVICDTNGGRMPNEVNDITEVVCKRFPSNEIGVHCHDDSGVGVAVSLAGVRAGATMVQGTMNGYGERNGNANLTTIIPNLLLKMGYSAACRSNLGDLRDLSLFVDEMANLRPNTRAPYVGASSFAHKGGLHADAAKKSPGSYEHIEPKLVGNRQRILISDLSGRGNVMMKAQELGVAVDEESDNIRRFLEELKKQEHQGYEYEAADASFRLLLSKWLSRQPEFFEVLSYRVIVERDEARNETLSEASVKLRIKGELCHEVAEARGPVGALDHALRKALEREYPQIKEVTLSDFKVRILESSMGTDAIIRVQIESSDREHIWGTVGASDNIIVASWEALKDSVEYKLQTESEGIV